jgi:hypothetical protein
LGVSGQIYEMAVFGSELIVGGVIDSAGGIPVNNIASWNGSSWSVLGTGTDDAVWALSVYDGDLYAGGYFLTAGDSVANRLARWDGLGWYPMGTGVDGHVTDLHVFKDTLVIAGNFQQVDGAAIDRIASWDGSAFAPMDTGLDDIGSAPPVVLIEYGDRLVCGAARAASPRTGLERSGNSCNLRLRGALTPSLNTIAT